MRTFSVAALVPFLLLGATTVLAEAGDCAGECQSANILEVNPDVCEGDEKGDEADKCVCKPYMDSKSFQKCAAKCSDEDKKVFAKQFFGSWCVKNMWGDSKASEDSSTMMTMPSASATSSPTATSDDSMMETETPTESPSETGAAAVEYARPGLAIAGGLFALFMA